MAPKIDGNRTRSQPIHRSIVVVAAAVVSVAAVAAAGAVAAVEAAAAAAGPVAAASTIAVAAAAIHESVRSKKKSIRKQSTNREEPMKVKGYTIEH